MTPPNPLHSAPPAVGEPTAGRVSQHQYEIEHRRVRAALAATPSEAAFPSAAFQDCLAFEHRTAEPVNEAVGAAREMLRFGEHEGLCTNHDDASGTEPCSLHAEAFERREGALRAKLAALDEAPRV
jgi:hypothetical protein